MTISEKKKKKKRVLWYLHPAIYRDLGEVEQLRRLFFPNFLVRRNICIVCVVVLVTNNVVTKTWKDLKPPKTT